MFKNCVSKLRLPLVRFASKTFESQAAAAPHTSTVHLPRLEKSINQVMLLGRVGSEPLMRGTEDHPVTVFTLATHLNYKYQSGDTQQKTEWHRVSVFRPYLRDSVYKYLNKGQRVLVQGKIMYGQITDAAGTVHTTTTIVADEVVFFNKPEGPLVEEEEMDTFS